LDGKGLTLNARNVFNNYLRVGWTDRKANSRKNVGQTQIRGKRNRVKIIEKPHSGYPW
jgi:hypothetical protein